MKTEERQQMKHESIIIGKATYEGKSKCTLQSLLELPGTTPDTKTTRKHIG